MSATTLFGGLAWFFLAHLISQKLELGTVGVGAMEIAYVITVAVLLYGIEENRKRLRIPFRRKREPDNRQVIRCLTQVAAFHDGDTALHCERIGMLAYELAWEMGERRKTCDTLRRAAVLHDLGKVAVDRSILNKPGPLTDEERAAVQLHVNHGATLLDRTKLPGISDPVLDVAMLAIQTHHEWWNGDGYPRGISGEEIPIAGRIVAVCDVFDALATDRPYRAALKPDAALEELRRSSGRQFDPRVVEAFERCFDRLLEIYDQ